MVEGEVEDALLLPVGICYEKHLEGQLFNNELLGRKKIKESLSGSCLAANACGCYLFACGSLCVAWGLLVANPPSLTFAPRFNFLAWLTTFCFLATPSRLTPRPLSLSLPR